MEIKTITPPDALDKLLVLNLESTIWSARKKLTQEDFGGIELPPAELASLGSKKICDPAKIATFLRLKARAVSLLDKNAVRFLGGWAIPEWKSQDIINGLNLIRTEFYDEKNNFLNEYDAVISEWIDKHSEWADIIRNSTVSSSYVAQRLFLGWQLFKVAPTQNNDTTLDDAVSNIGNTLFDEIAKDAMEIWTKVFEGKNEVTHKAISPISKLLAKLDGLSFVSPHAAPIVDIIKTVLGGITNNGKYISGKELLMLQGLVCMLKDKQVMLDKAETILHANDIPDSITDTVKEFSVMEEVPFIPQSSTTHLNSCGLW